MKSALSLLAFLLGVAGAALAGPAPEPLPHIPNPDGSRIAVLTGLVERGYEGAPHPRRLLVTEARLGEKF